MQASVKEVPKVFELVAGRGRQLRRDRRTACSGTPGGIKISITEPPAPKAPPAQVDAPRAHDGGRARAGAGSGQGHPSKRRRFPKTPAEDGQRPRPRISRNQIQSGRSHPSAGLRSKAKAEIKKEREAEEKRLTKAEFDRQNKAAKLAANGNPKVRHVDTDGISGGVVGGTTKEAGAGGKALTREQKAMCSTPIFAIVKQSASRTDSTSRPGLGDAVYAVAEFRLNAERLDLELRATHARLQAAMSLTARCWRTSGTTNASVRPASGRGDTISVTFRMKEERTAVKKLLAFAREAFDFPHPSQWERAL